MKLKFYMTDPVDQLDIERFFRPGVYELVDPRTNRSFYVGRSLNVGSRLVQHLAEETDTKYQVKQIRRAGFFPKAYILWWSTSVGDSQLLANMEKYWIKLRISQGCDLLNSCQYTLGVKRDFGVMGKHPQSRYKISKKEREANLLIVERFKRGGWPRR